MHEAKRLRELRMADDDRRPTRVTAQLAPVALCQLLRLEVKNAIAVSVRARRLARVDSPGRDQKHVAGGRQMPTAVELEAGRALDDVSDCQRVVHMRRIAMVNKGRVERFDPRQRRRPQETGLFFRRSQFHQSNCVQDTSAPSRYHARHGDSI
jgi:hypothetical protein